MLLLHIVQPIVTPCYLAYLIITSIAFRIVQLAQLQILEYIIISHQFFKNYRLPVRQRIYFHFILIAYKFINDMAPGYLCELVSIRKSSRKIRSSSQILLQVPVSRLKSYSDCAFSLAGRYQKCIYIQGSFHR